MGVLDCVKRFSETDFIEDLWAFDVPLLIAQGDDDRIVPSDTPALLSAALMKGSTLEVYPGGSHGLATLQQDAFNADLLAFITA